MSLIGNFSFNPVLISISCRRESGGEAAMEYPASGGHVLGHSDVLLGFVSG